MKGELIPVNRYQKDIMRDIEEAEWMGDDDVALNLKRELEYVQHEISRGATMIPNW